MYVVIRRVLVCAFGAFLLSACALTEDIVDLKYDPMKDVQQLDSAGKQFQIAVEDARAEHQGRIGAKINGFGVEMADIRSSVPVQEYVTQALTDELIQRGLVIEGVADRRIELAITALHNNFQSGAFTGTARGIAAFTVKVLGSAGAVLFDGAVTEVHVVEDIVLASGENAGEAVEGALKKALISLFSNDGFVAALEGA